MDWHRHPAKTEVYLQHLDQWQAALATALEQVMTLEPQEVGRPAQVRHWQRVAEAQGEARYRFQGRTEVKAVAQIHRTYVLAEHPAGLWLVEQHIAHERVLYEQLQDAWQVQPLETPLVLSDLTDVECQNLARLNLEAEPFGPRQWAIRQAPALFCQSPIARPELAAGLRELSRISDWDSALVAVACRSALRNGTPLELAQFRNC